MSWNTSVLLAKGKTLSDMEDVIPDVSEVTDTLLNWEDASSSSLGNNLHFGVSIEKRAGTLNELRICERFLRILPLRRGE